MVPTGAPRALLHGSKRLPLGRYLRQKLIEGGAFHDDRDAQARQRRADLQAVSEVHGTAAAVEALKLGPELGLIERFERKAKLTARKVSL